jgi:hypothetical protein
VAEAEEGNNVARLPITVASDFDGARLSWDPSDEPLVAGYRVYLGTASGVYSRTVDVGDQTWAWVTSLRRGRTYFFAVTAYDVFGNESPTSEEVSKAIR